MATTIFATGPSKQGWGICSDKVETTKTHTHVLNIFLMLFPPDQLQLILQLTNNELAMARKNYTTAGEIVKFFGLMLLVTWFEFGSQASLWSNTSTNKYIPAPSFGLTGMPQKQFNDLWMCIRFRDQPRNCPSDMTSEQYRWRLVDDFIKNFNEHQVQNFSPLDEICVDESMSRWYGQGGHWINHGLPMYVANSIVGCPSVPLATNPL